MASYLVQIAIGDYELVDAGEVGGRARSGTPSTAAWPTSAHRRTAAHGRHDPRSSTTCTGRIPFEAYGVLVVDEALGFALETQTLTIIGSDIAWQGRGDRHHPAARAGPPVGRRRGEPGHLEGHLAERGLRHLRGVAVHRAHRRPVGGRQRSPVRGRSATSTCRRATPARPSCSAAPCTSAAG